MKLGRPGLKLKLGEATVFNDLDFGKPSAK